MGDFTITWQQILFVEINLYTMQCFSWLQSICMDYFVVMLSFLTSQNVILLQNLLRNSIDTHRIIEQDFDFSE